MTTEVPLWSFERLSDQLPGNACVWTTARFAERAGEKFGREVVVAPIVPSPEAPAVVVVGGGTLIDRAKVWRQANEKDTALFAVPSIWGSGAENSPVAVINGEEEKQIFIGPEYLPDARMVWPELAREASEAQRRNACGDAWSHALEGFFSPIASREVRLELASVIDGLTRLSAEDDAGWFESSARACAGQARSSVGLIHGIAHVLEPRLGPDREALGHAALCRTFLWPVFRYDVASAKVAGLLDEFDLDAGAIERAVRDLFDRDVYRGLLPALTEHWKKILRDPCTRTNCVTVRPAGLEFFSEEQFDE